MPNERAGVAEALHRRIAEDLEAAMERGELLPNGKLPSELDLARQYGVSRGTVSKALDTLVRRGVLFRRRPVGTFVAPTPEGLRRTGDHGRGRNRRPVIGLIVPYLLDSFSGSVVLGVEKVTRSAGYEFGFAHSEGDREIERYHIDNFVQGGAAGLVIFPADPDVRIAGHELMPGDDAERIRLFEDLQRKGIPFVLVDRYLPGLSCDFVVSDDVAAGYAAAQHLFTLGHRRIGFVTTTPHVSSTGGRYLGYLQCLREHDLVHDERLVLAGLRQTSPASMPAGIPMPNAGLGDRAMLIEYLRSPDRPSALLAVQDLVALRVLHVAESIGLIIPDDMALVSCGGNDVGASARVPLTSIVQPTAELGVQAAHLVLDRIAGRAAEVRQVTLPISLVVRRSCGAVRRMDGLEVPRVFA